MFKTSNVMARRFARIGFGATLFAGGFAMAAAAHAPGGITAAEVAVGTWALAAIVYHALARRPVGERTGSAPHPRGRRDPRSLLATSLVVPALGLLVMLPLTIHMPFALAVGGSRGFDAWVILGYAFTLPTMLTVGALALGRAVDLAATGESSRWLSPTAIYWIGVSVSCVPFVVLFLIPPFLVAVTGLPFVYVFRHQERIVATELSEWGPELPRAVAVA